MKITLRAGAQFALLVALVVSGSLIAMDPPMPKITVFVKNSLWSATGAPAVQVTYTTKGKSNTRKVNPGQILNPH